MSRREQRESVFLLLFEHLFTGYSLEQIKENKSFSDDFNCENFNEFVTSYFNGILEHETAIDNIIEKNSLKWGKKRLSKVATAILRLAVYEILYRDDIPTSIAINEAVELAKKYGTDKESSFINGILGGISCTVENNNV